MPDFTYSTDTPDAILVAHSLTVLQLDLAFTPVGDGRVSFYSSACVSLRVGGVLVVLFLSMSSRRLVRDGSRNCRGIFLVRYAATEKP